MGVAARGDGRGLHGINMAAVLQGITTSFNSVEFEKKQNLQNHHEIYGKLKKNVILLIEILCNWNNYEINTFYF